MDTLNQFFIEELIQGLITHVDDKEMIKEKGTEILNQIRKIDDDMTILIVKLDGVANLAILKKKDIAGFNKKPDFINIEGIIEKVIESV